TEGLDPASRRALWQEVLRLNREQGLTVFLTTHYMEEADRLAQRLAIMDRGRSVAEGTPAALEASIGSDVVTVSLDADEIPRAMDLLKGLEGMRDIRRDESGLTLFVGNGAYAMPHIIRLLDGAGLALGPVTVSQPTLDEVFLRATGSRLE